MMDGHVRNTVEKHSTEFLSLKCFTEDTRENISLLIYSCRFTCHGSICFRKEKKKSGYFPSKMLQEFGQRSREIGFVSTSAQSSEHDRKISSCRVAAESTFVPFTFIKIHGREVLDLLSSKWSPWTSMSVNSSMKWHSIHYTRHLHSLIFLCTTAWKCSVAMMELIYLLKPFFPPHTPYFLSNSPAENKRPLFISSLWR